MKYIRTGLVVLSFPITCLGVTSCYFFVSFECDKGADRDEDSPCYCKSGEVLDACRVQHGLGGSGGDATGGSSVGGSGGRSIVTTNSGGDGAGGTGAAGGEGGEGGTGGAPPTGPCGPIPQTGYALCYYGLPKTGTDHVGFAGAIVPSGQDIMQIWADPMGSCVNAASASSEPYVMCDFGSLAASTVVQVEPGLHASQGASTSTFECSSSCTGSAILYKEGVQVGEMTNSIPTGVLSLVDHFSPPARKDIQFTSQ